MRSVSTPKADRSAVRGNPGWERRNGPPRPHHGAWLGQAGAQECPGMPGDADGMHREMRRVTGGEKRRLISLPA